MKFEEKKPANTDHTLMPIKTGKCWTRCNEQKKTNRS